MEKPTPLAAMIAGVATMRARLAHSSKTYGDPMTKTLLSAYTGPTGDGYPGYLNISRDGDEVVVTVRADPKKREGEYVCGYHPRDSREPGRCTPGNRHCNNYCNMKGDGSPMADAPLPCTHVVEGAVAVMRLPHAEAAKVFIDAFAELEGPE